MGLHKWVQAENGQWLRWKTGVRKTLPTGRALVIYFVRKEKWFTDKIYVNSWAVVNDGTNWSGTQKEQDWKITDKEASYWTHENEHKVWTLYNTLMPTREYHHWRGTKPSKRKWLSPLISASLCHWLLQYQHNEGMSEVAMMAETDGNYVQAQQRGFPLTKPDLRTAIKC